MSIVTTKTGVANLTAIILKVEPVTSIDPADQGSKFARHANRWYDTCRREVLRAHTWNHAEKQAQLAADATDPLFNYSKRYLLPSDYIRLGTLGDPDNPETNYRIKDGYIHCNLSAPVDVNYIYDNEDISSWPEDFTMCVVLKMCQRISYSMTGNRTMANEFKADYIEALSDAMGIDGQESPPPNRIRRSKWKAAKEGYSTIGSDYRGRVVT